MLCSLMTPLIVIAVELSTSQDFPGLASEHGPPRLGIDRKDGPFDPVLSIDEKWFPFYHCISKVPDAAEHYVGENGEAITKVRNAFGIEFR